MRERYKENLMTRAALYARYSSNNQSVSSIEGQFRISRDQADVAVLYKHFKFAGVTLVEGEISELHVGLKGTMNALFLKYLAAKTHRGLRGLVEKGKAGGGFLCIEFIFTLLRPFQKPGWRHSMADSGRLHKNRWQSTTSGYIKN